MGGVSFPMDTVSFGGEVKYQRARGDLPADQGFFRIVYLAAPDELSAIYDDLVAYAARFVRNA